MFLVTLHIAFIMNDWFEMFHLMVVNKLCVLLGYEVTGWLKILRMVYVLVTLSTNKDNSAFPF